ncbi:MULTISPECIES: helix-turn-helix domain-containing protein [Testudinibacter]|uniref:Antitoxin component HigA of HigAB toxin-antitoxin module n=1 Tax=Testudinibacter aquarius TaxID=1524974 RepID=A0A4R3Y6Q2_9PAST|nr:MULTISPECIES: transcriptional regulator [Testudinibacter]TNG93984.1 transcriptional regulator [Pasteurellaceae bacterium UScroc12]TNG94692.1 transcriptional regulator [Pasteurellaceae bacterium USgator41]TNG98919.1 transcriptional regulator [Pasteurellaceae bacterium UScroc31]TNH01218.1 transcriptional regulator [Pasteurellaceae bacterium USgator11]TNH03524.1 transcriptional regulator [Pasteurellaceae bacterium Phil31]
MKSIKLIADEQDYREALVRLSELMDLEPEVESEQDLELNALALLLEAYEAKHYPFPTNDVTALDIIKFKMEQNDLNAKDMVAYLGSPSKVSEVLSGKRRLSLTMIKKLHYGLGIPADLLLEI